MKNNLLPILLIISINFAYTQTAEFKPFAGKVYNMPSTELEKGHGPHVYDNEVIGEVAFPTLHFDKRNDEEGLPGIIPKDKFGLVLYSTLEISSSACYGFVLASDDGSKLWIDDELILNNDRPHKMKIKVDSLGLEAGTYPVKLWYYNAYPNQLGLMLKSKFVSYDMNCSDKNIVSSAKSFQSNLLFDFDKSELHEKAYAVLDSFIQQINQESLRKLSVIGHSDNVGTQSYNKQLSYLRAENVAIYLRSKLTSDRLEIIIEGKGESEPIQDNLTAESRSMNRRVEVVLTY